VSNELEHALAFGPSQGEGVAPSPSTPSPAGLPAGFLEELRQLYDDLGIELAKWGPVCALSGRCCRFHEFDHVLFLSEPEARFLASEAPAPLRPLDAGATCPWQDDRGRCQARQARPLGCRIYFCDPSFQEAMPVVGEAFLKRLKALTMRYGLAWNYAPLHHQLRRLRDEGVVQLDLEEPRSPEPWVAGHSAPSGLSA